jgi:hypothetical protein
VLIIGIELLLEEFAGIDISDWLRFSISVSAILLSLAYAHSRLLQKFRPVLVWVAQGFANFNEVFDWALEPFGALYRLVQRLVLSILQKLQIVKAAPVQKDVPTNQP